MSQTLREHRRRERLREYDAVVSAAGSALAVLALFAQGRESRAHGGSLEEAFAAPLADGRVPFPAAVWVALRQNDIDAVRHLLVSLSSTDFLVAANEQIDDDYRLVSVEENRKLPELDRLVTQLSAFVDVPADVIDMVAGWGPDDSRTAGEIDRLLDQRFGSPTTRATSVTSRVDEQGSRGPAEPVTPSGRGPANLRMSAAEFGALISLTRDQRRVLATLVRQTTITIEPD